MTRAGKILTMLTIEMPIIFKLKIIVNNRNILPAPAGVWVNYIVRITDNKIFGFSKNNGIEQEFISGFSTNNNLVEGTFLNNNNII